VSQSSTVIVGAGPAGMSAAVALAENGVRTTVIDENDETGGQIYRQPPAPLSNSQTATQTAAGVGLRQRFNELCDHIEFRRNTKVWGVFQDRQIAVTTAIGWEMIESERLMLATGAYEFVPPFPGWTLPGVLTPGAAQLMIKSMQVHPGQRVVLAGTGPFLLVVANYLLDAGVEVVAIVEAVSRLEAIASVPGLLHAIPLLRQGWTYLRRLKLAGVPIYTGHVVVEAEGDDQVEHVRFAPCNRQWQPRHSEARSIAADTLCVGYGFVPRTELAQLAGCQMQWKDELGGWIPAVDTDMASSETGVWVAGDGGGVAGAAVAEDEGTLAGLAVARDCSAITEEKYRTLRLPVDKRLNRLRRFRRAMDKLSRVRPGLSELARSETVVCRCEELTRGETDAAIAAGCTTCRTFKVATRLGMGPCQGRMCWPAMARAMAVQTGNPIEASGPMNARPPIVPVTLGELADRRICPVGSAGKSDH
jgi:NADPH-dependent 2,4-dienoyl-CoA reductase/sulfur reductase-like enzyme